MRVRAALKALELTLQEDVGLLKNQRRYLLKALRRSADVKSLDVAFGITGHPGRPHKTIDEQVHIAAEVLRQMLKGRNLEAAAHEAGPKCNVGSTQAREYWRTNKSTQLR